MNNGILIIAHAPLASALRQCVLHVLPDSAESIRSIDVQPNTQPEETLASARIALAQLATPQVLVLTDIFGATPANVAERLIDGVNSKLIAGVNLPMLMRAMTYRHESLDAMVARALSGGSSGVMQVAITAPQNQARKKNDQDIHQHQQ
jgi:mannose PTS system EIIA component